VKKLGFILALTLVSGVSLATSSIAQDRPFVSGIYHQDRLPNGTLTGPLGPDANGG
jgi:hypothetical protein